MIHPPKAIAFDVGPDSLVSLRSAFPGGEVEPVSGASTASLTHDWDPGTAELLVVGARDEPAVALGLCRGLRSQAGRARTPLRVLVRAGQEALVGPALSAGADSCLVLPVHVKNLVSMVARARAGNRPGRHMLNRDRSQNPDLWRDDGGEG